MTVRLGLARGQPDPLTDSLVDAIAMASASLDVRVGWIRSGEDEGEYDVVLAVGPARYYEWLLGVPRAAKRISWFGEPLPRGSAADARFGHRPGLGWSGGLSGSILRAGKRIGGPLTGPSSSGTLGRWLERAAIEAERAENLATMAWCHDRGVRIVVSSRDRWASLADAGIPASVVPFGYHERHAGPLTPGDSRRDIDVVVVGTGLSSTHRRRGRILAQLRPAMRRLGRIVEIEGRWGDERDALLRRSRVVLDVQRVPGVTTGLRWLVASAAGCAYVVEPMDDPAPLRAGIHHVEASADRLVAAVADVLADESRRLMMVAESQRLMRGDLAMDRSLQRVLSA